MSTTSSPTEPHTPSTSSSRRRTGHPDPPPVVETVVVGAGQAGLSTAYHLHRRGRPCLVLDAHERVGDQWRRRYDSLRLNTPARYDGLPGTPFPAPGSAWPTGREMADYLEAYAAEHGLDVRGGTAVERVERCPDGRYDVSTSSGRVRADHVVVAIGGERAPRVPDVSREVDPGIRQLHSSEYRNPAQLLPGPVLVVGAGQSGADIALELVRTGRETWLSGTPRGEIPVDLESRRARLAQPLLWFAANHVLTVRTPVGRRLRPRVRGGGAPLLRVKRADLVAAGVRCTGERVAGVDEGRPRLVDGTVLDVANVVWATGYVQDFGLVHPPVTGPDGWPLDDGGVVPSSPGLYFVGLLFQRGFFSMLVGGVGRDADRVAGHIAARARGLDHQRGSAAAAPASVSMRAQSPLATPSGGVSQEPPTQPTLGSDR